MTASHSLDASFAFFIVSPETKKRERVKGDGPMELRRCPWEEMELCRRPFDVLEAIYHCMLELVFFIDPPLHAVTSLLRRAIIAYRSFSSSPRNHRSFSSSSSHHRIYSSAFSHRRSFSSSPRHHLNTSE
ncbi:hypothetical protein IGI04_005162 [Brassica rapa subsp. trilocularis]|uniref:Uncharacterized protein n=1 Tax=Brassica rapa subsp. trilocularis TaxID=1813537 RepID=A0ABQ7ND67_BRACM|nr:hypothetical protein IGI04_005162 [Brassica rapa subsp. trilocularis]